MAIIRFQNAKAKIEVAVELCYKTFLSHGIQDFIKKISRDTGSRKYAGCGIMPKINTGYGKEPFFWWDTGFTYATGHQKFAFT